MESHCIRRCTIDAFDDVDFTHRWPVGSYEPESGPNATDTTWHMCNIGQKQALVVGLFTRDTDALTASI